MVSNQMETDQSIRRNPRYDIKPCAVGNHLFNIQYGFFLLRHEPDEYSEYEDQFVCNEHEFAYVHSNNQVILLKLKNGK
jgi:hypothetical protein